MAQSGRSIAEYMALVALVAFNCVVIRLLLTFTNVYRDFTEIVLVGVLPMANLLAIGSLPLLRRDPDVKPRPFRAGFLRFGGSAFLLLCLAALLIPGFIHRAVDAAIAPLVVPSNPKLHIVLPLFLLPQLAFALLGGWLNSRFRVTIQVERRPDAGEAEPAPGPQVVVQGSPP